jgi:hypothetical protein
MTSTICIWITAWILCGVPTYAISFAYWQGKYATLAKESYWDDLIFSACFALLGPVGLFVSFFSSGFAKYGFKFR